MKWTQAFKMALMAILSNKMRSILTMLGIIIGVFSVSVLVSVVEGSTKVVTDSFTNLGTNMLTASVTTNRPYRLELDDIMALKGHSGIAAVSPLISRNMTAKGGVNTYDVSVNGVGPDYALIGNQAAAQGRYIAQSDMDRRSAVCAIGVNVADELFGNRFVLGNEVSLSGRKYTVVGVLEEKGSSIMSSEDDRVIIPYTTAQRELKQPTLRSFAASAVNESQVGMAQGAIEALLIKMVGDNSESRNYNVFNQTAILDALDDAISTLTLMLGGIAGIALLVGGIGIMNIMLVSVTERTREIGIRKAVGAQRADVMVQFIIEAIVISVLGGILGLLLAYGVVPIIGNYMDTPMSVSGNVALIALGFSIVVGMVFGTYPAFKASRMQPIEALRYE